MARLNCLENGKISFPEFLELMKQVVEPIEEETLLLEAFHVFDSEGHGFIASKSLREAIIKVFEKSTYDVDKMLEDCLLNLDRQINYEGILPFV